MNNIFFKFDFVTLSIIKLFYEILEQNKTFEERVQEALKRKYDEQFGIDDLPF